MNELSAKLNQIFTGRVVRKDLVQRAKKGTNAPTFVLEFLLARYCATDDPDEIEAGMLAVDETLRGNFVRPNESNAAQSTVQQRGSHKFIDKVRVTHNEKEKRHWAEMENFGSKRIAINENHYREHRRLLEGGLWCEVMVGYNPVDDDDYAFYIEELRPIQVSRFDFQKFVEGRKQFTRDEWKSVLLRSIGLNEDKLTERQKMHQLARLIPAVEANYNYVELGPRGTGKSYAYAEFTPYSTLISGGQTTTATLFYNKVRRQTGIIGYWDTIAFDEVAGIRIKDPGTIQILKDYMANGRFNLGAEVLAPASLVFIGNIDDSVDDIVRSNKYDLFKPLPQEFDLAVIHRMHTFVPGWEIPPNAAEMLTNEYGFITDYLAEAFHHLFKHANFVTAVKKRAKLSAGFQGRDETAVYKTVSGLIKLLHPDGDVSDEEFEEYLSYAIEGRRRVKEQLNKRKADDEFADIRLGYTSSKGESVEVFCPESKGIEATQQPRHAQPDTASQSAGIPEARPSGAPPAVVESAQEPASVAEPLKEQHFTIRYGATGFSYQSIFGAYLAGAKKLAVEDPYIRRDHQVRNFLQVCELAVQTGTIKAIELITSFEHDYQKDETAKKLDEIKESLADAGIEMTYRFEQTIHDREIRTDTGWHISIGRGLDIYQKPDSWLQVGASNLDLRPCMETKVSIFHK
jgi:ATP-dependent Lon protease